MLEESLHHPPPPLRSLEELEHFPPPATSFRDSRHSNPSSHQINKPKNGSHARMNTASSRDHVAGPRHHEEMAASVALAIQMVEGRSEPPPSKKSRRTCKFPGCNRVIKSQGHCQRHGAKAKRCRVEGCDKQAQGTHDGMCKRHWKAAHGSVASDQVDAKPPPPEGESVYERVLPQSIAYRPPGALRPPGVEDEEDVPPRGLSLMPLVSFLREGKRKEIAWHRNAERRARGIFPVKSPGVQFEPWERQLALTELLLLSGGVPYADFSALAHAWGRERGFHHVLATTVCERRGEVERKRRSDLGRKLTLTEKHILNDKVNKPHTPLSSSPQQVSANEADTASHERNITKF